MGTQSRSSLAGLVIAVLLIGSASAEHPWPMFKHDQKHTSRTNFTGPGTPDLYWTFQANDAVTASPTIHEDGTVYVGAGGYYTGGGDSALYALNSDGSLKWLYKTDSGVTPGQSAGIFSSAAIGPDGAIYVGSLDAHMYCLEDSVTYGKLRWRNNPGGWPFYSSPLVRDDGVVFAGCLNFRFYAFNPDGELRWYYPTDWCVFSSPIIDDSGILHVGSKDHHLWTFRDTLPFPEVLWKHQIGTFYDGHLIDCSPAMGDDGTIYFGSDQYGAAGQTPVPVDTSFWAVNLDGTRKWALYIGDGVESSPAIGHDGTIYFGSYNGNVYAVDDSGSFGYVKWTFPTNGSVDASPTVDGDGTIYIGSRDSTMYALNPDGTVKWTYPTGGGIESSVTIDDRGHIYFGSFDGKVYCLGSGDPDVGVTSVDVPTQAPAGSMIEPAGRISNYRGAEITITVACDISDGVSTVYTDTLVMPDVDGGQYDYAVFAPFTVGPDTGVAYTVTLTTLLGNDDNPGNNQKVGQFVSSSGYILGCGDINADGMGPDIADLVYIVSYMFGGGPPPVFFESMDMNNDGNTGDIADLITMVNFMFQNGPPLDCGF